jgi:hypothetical protein
MITIVSQNKALINISNFNTIFVEEDDAGKPIIVIDVDGNNYILGTYNTIEDCIQLIDWIATGIAQYKTTDNITFAMPLKVSDNETET